MRLSFLFANTHISGKNRSALALADALVARGDEVRLVTTDDPLLWRGPRAEWVYIDDLKTWTDDRIVRAEDVPLVVDDEFFRERYPRENEPPRVLVAGTNVDDAYGAVAHARWFHQTVDLVRVAPWAPSREEPLDSVQEFHVALHTREMTRLVHSCDVAVFPGRLSLTALEAMASGLPCVGVDPSHRNDAVELGEKLIEVLEDAELRVSERQRGREIAQQYRVELALAKLLG